MVTKYQIVSYTAYTHPLNFIIELCIAYYQIVADEQRRVPNVPYALNNLDKRESKFLNTDSDRFCYSLYESVHNKSPIHGKLHCQVQSSRADVSQLKINYSVSYLVFACGSTKCMPNGPENGSRIPAYKRSRLYLLNGAHSVTAVIYLDNEQKCPCTYQQINEARFKVAVKIPSTVYMWLFCSIICLVNPFIRSIFREKIARALQCKCSFSSEKSNELTDQQDVFCFNPASTFYMSNNMEKDVD